MSSAPPFQSVSLHPPWIVTYLTLPELEPEQLQIDDELWGWFTEDHLQIQHPMDLIIDVGWYPENDPQGSWQLLIVKDQDWFNPVYRWETRSLSALLFEIEKQQYNWCRGWHEA